MTLQEIKNNSTYGARIAVLKQIAKENYNGDYCHLDYIGLDFHIQAFFHSTEFINKENGFEIYKYRTQILDPRETVDGRAVSVEMWEATRSSYDETGEPVRVEEYYTAYEPE